MPADWRILTASSLAWETVVPPVFFWVRTLNFDFGKSDEIYQRQNFDVGRWPMSKFDIRVWCFWHNNIRNVIKFDDKFDILRRF